MTHTKHLGGRLLALCVALLTACGVFAAPAPAYAEPGQFFIKKAVENPDNAPANHEYTFAIQITSDATIPPLVYSIEPGDEREVANGGTFALKDGETATFGLPEVDGNIVVAEVDEQLGDSFSYARVDVEGIPVEGEEFSKSVSESGGQTITFTNVYVGIETEATVNGSKTVSAADGSFTVEDKVTIKGLQKDAEYTVDGRLVKRSDGEVVSTSVESLKPSSTEDQTVTLSYSDLNAAELSGEALVAVVTVTGADGKVFEHANLDDANQTVTVEAAEEPEPATGSLKITKKVTTPKTDEKIASLDSDTSLTDTQKAAEKTKLKTRVERLKNTEFTFTVTLKGANGQDLTDEFNYTGSATGKVKSGDTIKLKDGQSVTIEGLPEGATYTVAEEAQDNWSASKTGDTGTIAKDEVAEASFTNTPLGQLKISKTIANANTDELKNTEFTFTVLFYKEGTETQMDGDFAYTGDKTGSLKSGGTVTLKGGQTIRFNNLPVGITARVREAATSGWTASSSSLRGTTVEGVPLSAAFTNTYEGSDPTPEPEPEPQTPGTGSLKISKTVVTPATDQSISDASGNPVLTEAARQAELARLQQRKELLKATEFSFTVQLTDADGNPLAEEYQYSGDKSGSISNGGTIELSDGQSVTIADLPEGTNYVVTEVEKDNWSSESAGSEGTIAKDEVAEASFTNTPLGQLRISKTLVNATTDELRNTEFTFTVLFYQPDSEVELTDQFSYTGDKAGTLRSGGTVTLKGGQSISFSNLPVGITVRVRETAIAGWRASSTSLRGTTVEGVPLSAAFVNTYVGNYSYSPNGTSGAKSTASTTAKKTTAAATAAKKATPNTGDATNNVVAIVLGGAALALVGAGLVVRRQK